MALINRVARLFAADAHAVMDKLEEPEILLRQAQRDMRAIVHEGEQEVTKLTRSIEGLRRTIAQSQLQFTSLGEELDVCFKAENEELAKTVVRRRLQLDRHVAQLNGQLEAASAALARKEIELRDRHLALEEVEQKIDVIAAVSSPAQAPASTGVTSQEVEVAFLREKQMRAGT